MSPLVLLDYASVLIFALTGALVASRAQLDVVGFAFLACLTAVGGGTTRDLLLDRHPVFWIAQPTYLAIACAAALLVFFTAHRLESRAKAILWLDAAALSVAVAAGSSIAKDEGAAWGVVLVMGVMTGCLGGLMRDVVANEVPLLLKQGEPYATCALCGALALLVAGWLGLPPFSAALVCAGVTFALRASALAFGWGIPVYKSRPPRA
ncbi:trimeric intracellular cation channel family protein [Yangia mangrovi]|uniref:Trimeric intracellular cation channel family protein n=1 Tax=Alloyangia mangrovi TaxID=1779329 RepID=A0A2A3JQ65_9RHOB|nr:trimeric intracellular cation channel family protein [Alloyangia mangrovi]MCA0941492.1 trimeric intracellular cation channel family protein [Alloyangia pacifica]MCT4371988.1 trimeric intracellular cation channel family protein [Alloyangia mangrovi]